MRIQTLAKLKEIVDELEVDWKIRLEHHNQTNTDKFAALPAEAIAARDAFGMAGDLYLRFLKQFTRESQAHMISIGYVNKPQTFLAQRVEEEAGE